MRNIIFLDIDGVLNSLPYHELSTEKHLPDINIDNVKVLSKIVETHNAMIVLSSTWRVVEEHPMYHMMERMLKQENIKIHDKTKIIGNNRPLEIMKWIEENGEEEDKYLILDDDFSIDEYKQYNLDKFVIHTYYFCYSIDEGGLQERHINIANQIFYNQ